MNKIFNICTLVFSMLILFSCEPGRAENGDLLFGIKENNSGATSRLLSKITSHSIDLNTGEISDENYTFNYMDKKLISMTDKDGNVMVMTYNSSNKITKMETTGQTVTFEFSGSNVSKMVSIIPGVLTTTSTFTYNGTQLSKVVTINELTISQIPMKLYMESNNTYTGANITKTVFKSGAYDDQGVLVLNPLEQSITYTFDTNKSPYKLLPAEFLLYLAGMGPQGSGMLSANNPLTYKYQSDLGVQDQTITNIYDNQQYLTKSSTASGEYNIYEYK